MRFLKTCGEMYKKYEPWLTENLGDLLITVGLLMIPLITFFVSVVIGFYVLSVVIIIIGLVYIRAKGGE